MYHQPKLKRAQNQQKLANKISEQNPVLVKKKNPHLIHSQHHRSACRILNESHDCSTIFIISYQTLAQCMCQSGTPISNMYNLHNILYKISHNSISKPRAEQKNRYSIKYLRNISWDIYMSIISQNKIYPYLRHVPAVCPMFQ